MPFLRDADAAQLRQHFHETLKGPVEIDLFITGGAGAQGPGASGCELCPETAALLGEVAALSDRITLRVHDLEAAPRAAHDLGLGRAPSFALRGATRGRVRYLGIPSGWEFATLLGDLVDVSRGATDLHEKTRRALSALEKDVHIQVFVTPGCPYCPGAARLAHKMAVESPRVTADVVEVSEFPDLAERYGVQGVPMIVVNDTVHLVGAQPEAAFLQAVVQAAA